jgi:hypothetical protein
VRATKQTKKKTYQCFCLHFKKKVFFLQTFTQKIKSGTKRILNDPHLLSVFVSFLNSDILLDGKLTQSLIRGSCLLKLSSAKLLPFSIGSLEAFKRRNKITKILVKIPS